jgi:hypothetical protein
MTPGIGFDNTVEQIEGVAATGDHDAPEQLNALADPDPDGPSEPTPTTSHRRRCPE